MKVYDVSHLIETTDENKRLIKGKNKCDTYDYLTSVVCGAIGGIVDVFLVDLPQTSKLAALTDKQVDKAVMSFAKTQGWDGGRSNSVKSAIGYLENGSAKTGFSGFKVNYDQATSAATGGLVGNMSTKNHHMLSLAHSPSIVGLFFSILNQFTSTSTFVQNGSLITIGSDSLLLGSDLPSKLFCGIANWFGHIMSDVAGSSGAAGRGSGIVIPFFELFGFCNFGSFKVGKYRNTLSQVAVKVFEEGYDFRFGLAMAIPVLITDLSIKLIWALRRHFEFGYPIEKCFPSSDNNELRTMLLVGHGTLCIVDAVHAGIMSGGNAVIFFSRLNLIAWTRFIWLVIKEICIQLLLPRGIEQTIEAFKKVNAALNEYLEQLKELDIKAYRAEVERTTYVVTGISKITSNSELNNYLEYVYLDLNIEKPWQGDFDEFMSDPESRLVFK